MKSLTVPKEVRRCRKDCCMHALHCCVCGSDNMYTHAYTLDTMFPLCTVVAKSIIKAGGDLGALGPPECFHVDLIAAAVST